MASVRSLIVDDLVDALGAIDGTGSYSCQVKGVYHWQRIPGTIEDYPALVVADIGERMDELVFDLYARNLSVIVQGTLLAARGGDSADNEANDLIADIERAVMADYTRGGNAINTRIVRSQTFLLEEADPYVVIEVELTVSYRTLLTDPSAAR